MERKHKIKINGLMVFMVVSVCCINMGYYLTDTFPIGNGYYYSLGDLFLILGMICYIASIIKYPLFYSNK